MSKLPRIAAAALLGLVPCFWIAGCFALSPQRGTSRDTRAEGPPNRRLAVRPERRVTQARRDERRREAQPWLSQW
jgi:hypothetical protein